jgi:hypothetical protein
MEDKLQVKDPVVGTSSSGELIVFDHWQSASLESLSEKPKEKESEWEVSFVMACMAICGN